MSAVEFVDLPPSGRQPREGTRNDPRYEFRMECRRNPGAWAIYSVDAWVSQSDRLRRSKYWAGFEVVTRSTLDHGKGRAAIYVRFVGDSVD